MMMMRRHQALLVSATLLATGVAALWAQQPAAPGGPPRGASGPPEHAKVTPINNLPNPYETVRNWGTLPDGRKWGSVSAVQVDIDGKSIWAGAAGCWAQRAATPVASKVAETRSAWWRRIIIIGRTSLAPHCIPIQDARPCPTPRRAGAGGARTAWLAVA